VCYLMLTTLIEKPRSQINRNILLRHLVNFAFYPSPLQGKHPKPLLFPTRCGFALDDRYLCANRFLSSYQLPVPGNFIHSRRGHCGSFCQSRPKRLGNKCRIHFFLIIFNDITRLARLSHLCRANYSPTRETDHGKYFIYRAVSTIDASQHDE